MISAEVLVVDNTNEVRTAAKRGAIRSLAHGAAVVRREAIDSIVEQPGPSDPGQPPATRRGQLPRAILFAVEDQEAVIGPAHSIVGIAGSPHERGGSRGKQRYPRRPFMAPALDRSAGRFAAGFAGCIY